MFRAAVLWIVMTLATGPNAALLCDVWCHSGDEVSGACEPRAQAAAPGIVGNDECAVNGNPVVFVREDGRRNGSTPDVAGVVAVARFAMTPRPAGSLSAYEPSGRPLLELRPLALALRI